jgi:hypothetical protein
MEDIGIFYVRLVNFAAIWYFGGVLVFSMPFGIFLANWYIFPELVFCAKKNLATLSCKFTHWIKSECLRGL